VDVPPAKTKRLVLMPWLRMASRQRLALLAAVPFVPALDVAIPLLYPGCVIVSAQARRCFIFFYEATLLQLGKIKSDGLSYDRI
jgi:hypothetical protein